MQNYWLEEIRLRQVVGLLQKLLNDEFAGQPPEPKDWIQLIEDLIDTLYSGDIVVIDGLMRYEIVCVRDEYGLIEKLSLEEKY